MITAAKFEQGSQETAIKLARTASIDTKAMERNVLSYLTKPITNTLSEGLGKR